MIYVEEKFREFCLEQGDQEIDGHNILSPENDLLFNIAGMTAIKSLFLDENTNSPNLFSAQRCIRVNDIEEVGDLTHLTSFVMLGFFSFGKYDNAQAISRVWKFLSFFFSPEELFVVINEKDIDSQNNWKKYTNNIKMVYGEENMWYSGEFGPCGIGSEVFFQKNNLEIANIVQINSNKTENGIVPRTKTFIDMGMGLERLYLCQKNALSVFDIPLFDDLKKELDIDAEERKNRIALDHYRTIKIMMKQVQVGNHKQGYVLKRLIRRLCLNFNIQKIPDQNIRELCQKEEKLLYLSLEKGKKYWKDKKELNKKDIEFLSGTLGCNLDMIKMYYDGIINLE